MVTVLAIHGGSINVENSHAARTKATSNKVTPTWMECNNQWNIVSYIEFISLRHGSETPNFQSSISRCSDHLLIEKRKCSIRYYGTMCMDKVRIIVGLHIQHSYRAVDCRAQDLQTIHSDVYTNNWRVMHGMQIIRSEIKRPNTNIFVHGCSHDKSFVRTNGSNCCIV